MTKTNYTVYLDVRGAVLNAVTGDMNGALRRSVHVAVHADVYWAVEEPVRGAVHRGVVNAVDWAVNEDSPHPGLQDFLFDVGG
jgi:hypothetical protein